MPALPLRARTGATRESIRRDSHRAARRRWDMATHGLVGADVIQEPICGSAGLPYRVTISGDDAATGPASVRGGNLHPSLAQIFELGRESRTHATLDLGTASRPRRTLHGHPANERPSRRPDPARQ